MSTWAVEEYAGIGPGGGAASLGFAGYDPAQPRIAEAPRFTEPAFSELGFLVPNHGMAGLGLLDHEHADTAASGF